MIFVALDREFEDKSARQVSAPDGHLIAVYRLGGDFYATDELCTHGEGWLSEGEMCGYEIMCPLHGGAFDIRTGQATQSPCHIPLATYRVVQKDGMIFVDVPSPGTVSELISRSSAEG